MNEPTLFDAVETKRDTQEQEEKYRQIARIKEINIKPDDITVIRILAPGNAFNDWDEHAQKFIEEQIAKKFDIYADRIYDIEGFKEWAINEISKQFCPIAETLLDASYTCAEEMHSFFIGAQEDNIEYLAYLYNINAPFHQKQPINYRELIKALRASI